MVSHQLKMGIEQNRVVSFPAKVRWNFSNGHEEEVTTKVVKTIRCSIMNFQESAKFCNIS